MIDKESLKKINERVAKTKCFKKPSINSAKEHCTFEGNIKNHEFNFTYGQWPIQLSYVINGTCFTKQSHDIESALSWMERMNI